METKTEPTETTTPEVESITSLTRVEDPASLVMVRPPDVVLSEANRAAKALMSVVNQKPKKVILNNEQFLEFEDWQTLGRFYGITVKEDGDPEFVQLGNVCGFKASAVALLNGETVLSRATAYCLNDEEKWSSRPKYEWVYVLRSGGTSVEDPGPNNIVWEPNPNKPGGKRPKKIREQTGEERVPLFQLASMAQTRAGAKAFRNVLSWVAVLAGYRPTPAEEIMDMAQARTVPQVNPELKKVVEKGESAWTPQTDEYNPDEAPWPEEVFDTPPTEPVEKKKEFLPPPAGYEGPAKNAVPVEKGNASYKQLTYIRELCKKMKLDPDEEARDQLGKRLTELNSKDASNLIEYLKGVGY